MPGCTPGLQGIKLLQIMEYIPRPFCSSTPPIDVPLLDNVKFHLPQPGELLDFTSLYGTGLPPSPNISPEALATLIQSRLFFGLVIEFLDYTPDLTQFSEIKKEGGESVQYVRMEKISEVFTSRRDLIIARLSSINLQAATKCLDRLEVLPAAHFNPVPKVALSARILVDTLYLYAGEQIGQVVCSAASRHLNSFHDRNVPPSLRILFQRLQENSWCPSRIFCLSRIFGYLYLYYMSEIPRSHPHSPDHRACSGLVCTATNLQREPVDRPRHLHRNCKCSLLRVPMDKVIKNLQKGVISLVRVIRDGEDGLSLEIEPAKINSRYIAISHVWSDGMGNSFENGLFSCQLDYISPCISQLPVHGREAMSTTALDRIENPIPIWAPLLHLTQKGRPIDLFWLDTLCIPAKFAADICPDHKEMRQIAISLIYAVFSGATRVLILDAEMQNVRRSASSVSEIFARLLGCNWASRAWTFQETQALRCSVQLQDGAFDPRDEYLLFRDWRAFRFQQNADFWQAWQRLFTHSCPKTDFTSFFEQCLCKGFQKKLSITWFRGIYELVDSVERNRFYLRWSQLHHQLASLAGGLNDQRYARGSQRPLFDDVWNQLMVRSSTDVDDVVLILAMSLQLPVYEILQKPVDERLKSIIWYVRSIPRDFLFLPYHQLQNGPKELDRWVPTRLEAFSIDNALPFLNDSSIFPEYQKFCPSKHTMSIRFPISSEPCEPYEMFVMIIPDTLPNVPQISLIYRNKEYMIRFHRPENSQLNLDSFSRTFLIVDTTLVGAENTDPSRNWVAGCCLREISDKETSSRNSALWDMNVIYDCAISVASDIPQIDCIATSVPQTSIFQTEFPSLRSDNMTFLYVTHHYPEPERFAEFSLACSTFPLIQLGYFRVIILRISN